MLATSALTLSSHMAPRGRNGLAARTLRLLVLTLAARKTRPNAGSRRSASTTRNRSRTWVLPKRAGSNRDRRG